MQCNALLCKRNDLLLFRLAYASDLINIRACEYTAEMLYWCNILNVYIIMYFKLFPNILNWADALRKYLLTQTPSPTGQNTPDVPGLPFSVHLKLLLWYM